MNAVHPGTQTRDVGVKIAKVLVEAHQGSLDVQSDGRGTNIVYINLPAARIKPLAGRADPALPSEGEEQRLADISAALAEDPRVRFARAGVDVPDAPATGHVKSLSGGASTLPQPLADKIRARVP